MKNLGVFYLILVILFSLSPCGDEEEPSGFALENTFKIEHDKNTGSAETCSPICICSCCGQSIVLTKLLAFEVGIPVLALKNTISTYNFSLEQHAQNIWQPPKIA